MDSVLLAILSGGGFTFFVVAVFLLVLASNPDKVEKWASILNKLLSRLGGLFRSAHKRYVKHDLQSRINGFTKEASRMAPYLEENRLAIEWVNTKQSKKAFLENGQVVLRLRREDPEDLNFVHGAYWSVSTRLLPRVKRYVSPSQRQALDLYVTTKLIENQKFSIIDKFLEYYLHPYMGSTNGKVANIYDQFDKIDRYGVFYPVLLQELYFLSMKVFGGPKSDKIVVEVTRLIDFLERVACRNVGDEETDLDFYGEFCRFGIVIVGKSYKMSFQGPEVYSNFIERELMPAKSETVYLLGKPDYADFINEICGRLETKFEVYRIHQYKAVLLRGAEKCEQDTYLVVLRAIGVDLYQPS